MFFLAILNILTLERTELLVQEIFGYFHEFVTRKECTCCSFFGYFGEFGTRKE